MAKLTLKKTARGRERQFLPVNHEALLGCLFKGYDLVYYKTRGLLFHLVAQRQCQSVQCPLAVYISNVMEVCTEAETRWGTSSMDVALGV